MPIKNIDRQTCRLLSQAIEKALQPIADEHGISIKMGRGTYGDMNATLKIEIAVKGEGGEVISKDAEALKRYQGMVFGGDVLNKVVTLNGEQVKIIGYKPRSSKYPVLGTRLKDGKTYKYTEQSVKRALAHTATPPANGLRIVGAERP